MSGIKESLLVFVLKAKKSIDTLNANIPEQERTNIERLGQLIGEVEINLEKENGVQFLDNVDQTHKEAIRLLEQVYPA